MTYVSWAALYEGETDRAYLEVLVPRVMEELVLRRGIRHSTIAAASAVRLQRGPVEKVAKEVCEAKDAFFIFLVHADTGGRALEAGIGNRSVTYCEAVVELCSWSPTRCVPILPRHEVEAWALADPQAVTAALGYTGAPDLIGLPDNGSQAERLGDPKATLASAVGQVRGRRRPFAAMQLLPAIAQRQSLDRLRQATSFAEFEARTVRALADLGCI